MTLKELKEFLDEKVILYNNPKFIESDPIQIPHQFSKKEDIEIAAFLTATISWGNRKMIIKNAFKMMELLGNSPYDFVLNHTENDLVPLSKFVYRTFNGKDCMFFIQALKNIYTNHNGLESVFTNGYKSNKKIEEAIGNFRKVFLSIPHETRTEKHLANPLKGSSAKRINMYLRWMVRQDNKGVDFGIWKSIKQSHLLMPLDVHSGNVARKLGLLNRSQNDAKALAELDTSLRKLDPTDPVKYDFALFGLGVFEKF